MGAGGACEAAGAHLEGVEVEDAPRVAGDEAKDGLHRDVDVVEVGVLVDALAAELHPGEERHAQHGAHVDEDVEDVMMAGSVEEGMPGLDDT